MLQFLPENRLSFQQFFAHPYLNSSFSDSLKASRGSSVENVSVANSPRKSDPLLIHDSGTGEDDYVIIDSPEDSELNEFLSLELDRAGSINTRSVVHMLEGALESSTAISNLAEKIYINQGEVVSALSLYTKAALVINQAIETCELTIATQNLKKNTHSDIFTLQEKIK
jgi:hypothetical protein